MSKNNEVMEVEKQEVAPAEGTERMSNRRLFSPRTDIFEKNDQVIVVADMPGVDEKSINVDIEKNVLTINGKVGNEEYPNHSLMYREYEVGDYQRKFTLSNEIDIDKIEAKMKDGVLQLFLPKISPTMKKIDVRMG